MKLNIARMAFGVIAGLIALAVPGYSSTMLTFDDSSADSGGNVSLSGTTILSISDAIINQLTVGGTNYAITGGYLNMSGSGSSEVLTIAGSVTIGSHTLDETLATIYLNSALTANSSSGLLAIPIGSSKVSSITWGANLLADLGISGATTYNTGFIDGGTITSGSATPNSSEVEATITATPEPASWLLMGSGLLGIAFFARRKSLQRV